MWTIGVAVGRSAQAGASVGFGVVNWCSSRTRHWCVSAFDFRNLGRFGRWCRTGSARCLCKQS